MCVPQLLHMAVRALAFRYAPGLEGAMGFTLAPVPPSSGFFDIIGVRPHLHPCGLLCANAFQVM